MVTCTIAIVVMIVVMIVSLNNPMSFSVLDHTIPPCRMNPSRSDSAVLNIVDELCKCHCYLLITYIVIV